MMFLRGHAAYARRQQRELMEDTTMTPAYLAAMAKSYANQRGGLTIPAGDLSQLVTLPLGFQPLAVVSQVLAGGITDLAVAAYFEPAVCLIRAERNDEEMRLGVRWIRGVDHGVESMRLFPGLYLPGGANRCQTANFGPGGELWVSRNGEREFFVLSPPDKLEGRWRLSRRAPSLQNLPTGGDHTLHSAKLGDDGTTLHTVESSADGDRWWLCVYTLQQGIFTHVLPPQPLPPYLYGVEILNGVPLLVTDHRSDLPAGIYRMSPGAEPELVAAGVNGTGLCALADGSLIVSTYGQSHPGPFNGTPGSLTIVPAEMIK